LDELNEINLIPWPLLLQGEGEKFPIDFENVRKKQNDFLEMMKLKKEI